MEEFEPYIAETVNVLLGKWDGLAKKKAESSGSMKGYAV